MHVLDPFPGDMQNVDVLTISGIMERINDKYGPLTCVLTHVKLAHGWNEESIPQMADDPHEESEDDELSTQDDYVTIRVCGNGLPPKPSTIIQLRRSKKRPSTVKNGNAEVTYKCLPQSLRSFVSPFIKMTLTSAMKFIRIVKGNNVSYRVQRGCVKIATVKDSRIAVLLTTILLMAEDVIYPNGGLEWLQHMMQSEENVKEWIHSVDLESITKRI